MGCNERDGRMIIGTFNELEVGRIYDQTMTTLAIFKDNKSNPINEFRYLVLRVASKSEAVKENEAGGYKGSYPHRYYYEISTD